MIAHFDVTNPPHIHYRFDLVENIFFVPWNYGVAYGHVLWASNCASEWKASPGVIFKFDVDATSSRWRFQIAGGARLSLSRFPSSLVVLHLSELLCFSDFVASRPRFWWWTWNCLWRLLWNWRQFHLRMVFNS